MFVLEYGGRCILTDIDEAPKFAKEPFAEITAYSVVKKDKKPNQLVAVTSKNFKHLNVVGSCYGSSDEHVVAKPLYPKKPSHWTSMMDHTLIYGDLIQLPEYYEVILKEGALEVVFDHETRFESISTKTPARFNQLLTRIRELTELETETIKQQIRNLEESTSELAVQYVLDPLLTCAILEDFTAKKRGHPFIQTKNYQAIRENFKSFYLDRRPLFDSFIGRAASPEPEQFANFLEVVYTVGQNLDVTQLIALKTALSTPGFTCISGPAGSGKTMLINKIIAAKLFDDVRFAVYGASNSADANIADNYNISSTIKYIMRAGRFHDDTTTGNIQGRERALHTTESFMSEFNYKGTTHLILDDASRIFKI